MNALRRAGRVGALSIWAFAVWLVLTGSTTTSELLFGAGIALVGGIGLEPLGGVARPWALLELRRLGAIVAIVGYTLVRVIAANCWLASRCVQRRPRIETGMIIVATRLTSEAGLGALGLLSSLSVDNQIIDIDRERGELQYHSLRTSAPHDRVAATLEALIMRAGAR